MCPVGNWRDNKPETQVKERSPFACAFRLVCCRFKHGHLATAAEAVAHAEAGSERIDPVIGQDRVSIGNVNVAGLDIERDAIQMK